MKNIFIIYLFDVLGVNIFLYKSNLDYFDLRQSKMPYSLRPIKIVRLAFKFCPTKTISLYSI